MSTVTTDVAKNRLVVTLAGSHDEAAARKGTEESVAAFRSMRPGFDLVIDMAELEVGTAEVMEVLAQSKAMLAEIGAGRVVRVLGDGSRLGAMQVERAGESNYDVTTADSLEEAHAYLDRDRLGRHPGLLYDEPLPDLSVRSSGQRRDRDRRWLAVGSGLPPGGDSRAVGHVHFHSGSGRPFSRSDATYSRLSVGRCRPAAPVLVPVTRRTVPPTAAVGYRSPRVPTRRHRLPTVEGRPVRTKTRR